MSILLFWKQERLKAEKGATMRYDCNLTETDEDSGYCCPLNDPNETLIEDCKDCAFAKEREEE